MSHPYDGAGETNDRAPVQFMSTGLRAMTLPQTTKGTAGLYAIDYLGLPYHFI